MDCRPFAGTPFKYEYRCVNQQDVIVANGEFILRIPCTIRSHLIVEKGVFGVFDNARKELSIYRGRNHLKKIMMTVTNTITGSVRQLDL